jgi:hypothetical protein
MTTVEQLAAEVREQNQLYESGDKDKAFWTAQQKRLQAMYDQGVKQIDMARMVGKSSVWVSTVLAFTPTSASRPTWHRSTHSTKADTAKAVAKAVTDPAHQVEVVREALKSPSPEVVAEIEAAESAGRVGRSPTPDPWESFAKAIRLLRKCHRQVYPGMWREQDEAALARIARDATEQAEFLSSLAEAAQQRVEQASTKV